MLYELKKYVPHPGKSQAVKDRFERIVMAIFARVGIRVLHCWEDRADPDAFYYLTVFASAEQRDAAWKTFGADPEWKAAKAASETGGPLLMSQTTTDLLPTRFSPAAG